MGQNIAGIVDRWLDRRFSYPGIEKKLLIRKKNIWIANLICFSFVAGIFIFLLVFRPELKIMLLYAVSILLIQTSYLVSASLSKGLLKWLIVLDNNLFILITFFVIMLFGGIPTSCGLVFVGFAVIFLVLPLLDIWLTLELTSVYILSILIVTVFRPFSPAPSEVPPEINKAFFAVNFIWMSATITFYTLQFIRNSIRLQEYETIRLKELNEVKTKLFTNITHEFRTPLTIILGMADLLSEKPEQWLKSGTLKIKNNACNLLYLVNQMLDLSKLEAGAMPVYMQQSDIVVYMRYIVESFLSVAETKLIRLNFITDAEHQVIDYDPEKVLLILSNLVGNAIKYTPEGGAVMVSLSFTGSEGADAEIRVSDTGPGISPADLPFIFDRFYQAESNDKPGGTGLGLAIVKEMTRLMNGDIRVESLPGEGTVFVVRLPVTNQAPFKEISDHGDFIPMIAPEGTEPATGVYTGPESMPPDDGRPLLLIVEDSNDVIGYLSAILENDYNISVAHDGREGLKKAIETVPDIIVTDVKMPEMDGVRMLTAIKADFRTSHIPVIMLTAKADIDSRLKGLERGADDYIAKPFNKEELMIRLKKLIEMRRKLQQRYASMDTFTFPADKLLKTEDAFIIKIRKLMEENLDDDQFGIRQLCLAVGMSRAQVYRKFRTLTDKTINEYLMSFRLHKAKEMLRTTGLNVSQVAFEVGFKNLSHFSRAFNAEFGRNPSEFKKEVPG